MNLGGKHADGYFFAPTVLKDVDDSHRIVSEEQFGPVIPVIKYQTVDEAVRRANDTNFGLGGSVWGEVEKANEVAMELDSGAVWVNDHGENHFSIPFGGVKGSGIGKEGGGVIGLKEYVDMRTMKIRK